ncbi:MAG: hypothetical protein ACRDD8_11315 [Bacteroidales bacterium]
MSKKVIAYHGSPNKFDAFDSRYMGRTGTVDGYGFYFTTSKDVAEMFSDNSGYVYTCELDIKGVLSNEKILIPKPLLVKIIKYIDSETDGDLLSEFGDVYSKGENVVLQICLQHIYEYNKTDADVFSVLVNVTNNLQVVSDAFNKFGYNAILNKSPKWGDIEHQVIVMTNTNDIKILNVDKLGITNESYKAKFVSDMILKA